MAALWGLFTIGNLFGFVLIFFILAIAHRQLNNIGMPFNKWIGFLMLIPYFLVDKFLPLKFALLVGLFGGLLAGFFGGIFLGGDEDDGGSYE